MNTFESLAAVDVSEFTEKKGQFTYLSWADAVNVLLKHFPDATWVVSHNHDGWPYFPCPAGAFVEVTVTIDSVPRTQVHPVLDYRNKPISEPDSFQVNTAIQRCLAKAISLHGLGLYIYRGEDLPEAPKGKMDTKPVDQDKVQHAFEFFRNKIDEDDIDLNHEIMKAADARLTNDEKSAVAKYLSDLGKAPGSNKKYTTLLREYMEYKPTVTVNPDFFDANMLPGDK